MLLTSKNNPLIKETASLKEKKGRKELGLFLVEGRKMSVECQKSEMQIERVFLSQSYTGENPFPESITVLVSDEVFRYLSDEKTPQGILCRVKIPDTTPVLPTGRCLLLDGVSDPGNLGTILRTANASGYEQVYLTPDCADPFSPKTVRASMSGVFFTHIYQDTRENLLQILQDTPIVIADMNGESVFSFTAPTKFALVIGNEGNGVSDTVRANASHTVKIPMKETQESLNAGVSAGILMYMLNKEIF